MTVHTVILEYCIFPDHYYCRGSDIVDDDGENDVEREKNDNCELSFVTFLTAKYIKKNGNEEEEEVKKRYYDFSFGRNRMLCSVQCVRHESMIALCLYIINMKEYVRQNKNTK